jgi:hypothetical protein
MAGRAQVSHDLVEVVVAGDALPVFATQELVEVVVAAPTASPTSVTGAGVSQELVEVVAQADNARAATSQALVEVVVSPDEPAQISHDLVEVVVVADTLPAFATQELVEVVVAAPTAGYYLNENGTDRLLLEDGSGLLVLEQPTSVTGAGVSQDLVEVVAQADNARAAASQALVEVVLSIDVPPTPTLTADAVIRKTQSASFTADAVIRQTRSGSFTADAIIRKTQAGSFTADAVIRRTQSASFTADAVITAAATAQSGSFTADAVIQKTQSASFTADAVIRRTQSASFTADAVIRRTQAATFTADAVVRKTQAAAFTADAIVRKTQSGSFTADAVIVTATTTTGSFTVNAVVRKTQAATLTADAVITTPTSFIARAIIRRNQSATFTANAVLAGRLLANAVIRKTQSSSFTAGAWIYSPRADPGGPGEPGETPLISVIVDGEDITAALVLPECEFKMLVNGGVGECRMKVRDDDHIYSFTTGDEVTVDIDGKRRYGGYLTLANEMFAFPVVDTTDPTKPSRFHMLSGTDYNILLQKRVLYDKAHPANVTLRSWPAGSHDDVVIRYVITNYTDLPADGVTMNGVTHVGSPNPDKTGVVGSGGLKVVDALTEINRLISGVFYIDPYKDLNFVDVDTPDAAYGLSDRPGVGEVGYRELEQINNGAQLVNDAMVWGAGTGSRSPVFGRTQDAPSIATHGRWQYGEFTQALFRQSSVNFRANTIVNGTPQSKRGGKNDQESWSVITFSPAFTVGQKVPIESEVYGKSDVVPIRRMTLTFPTHRSMKFALWLSHEIDDPWNSYEFWFPRFPGLTFSLPNFDAPEASLPVEDCPDTVSCTPVDTTGWSKSEAFGDALTHVGDDASCVFSTTFASTIHTDTLIGNYVAAGLGVLPALPITVKYDLQADFVPTAISGFVDVEVLLSPVNGGGDRSFLCHMNAGAIGGTFVGKDGTNHITEVHDYADGAVESVEIEFRTDGCTGTLMPQGITIDIGGLVQDPDGYNFKIIFRKRTPSTENPSITAQLNNLQVCAAGASSGHVIFDSFDRTTPDYEIGTSTSGVPWTVEAPTGGAFFGVFEFPSGPPAFAPPDALGELFIQEESSGSGILLASLPSGGQAWESAQGFTMLTAFSVSNAPATFISALLQFRLRDADGTAWGELRLLIDNRHAGEFGAGETGNVRVDGVAVDKVNWLMESSDNGYWLKWERIPGDVSRVKLWVIGQPEPDDWLVERLSPLSIPLGGTLQLRVDPSGLDPLGTDYDDGVTLYVLDFDRKCPESSSPGGADRDEFTGDGSTTVLTLASPYAPGSTRAYVDGYFLRPGFDYTESDPAAGEITLNSPPLASHPITVFYTVAGLA